MESKELFCEEDSKVVEPRRAQRKKKNNFIAVLDALSG
jgi:hypothetical protein